MSEILEKASDPVGGGETGASYVADPVEKNAKRKQDKEGGEKVAPQQGSSNEATPQNGATGAADTIKAKPSAASGMQEELDGLFGDELSEDFKAKATVIFEAAIHEKVEAHKAALEEEYAAKATALEEEATETFTQAVEDYKAELAEQVDSYMNYVVENWMKENEVAIETSLNAQIAEDFMGKLRNLFVESYIEVPESKVDLVDELAAKVKDLEESLNSAMLDNIENQSKLAEATQKEIFSQVAEGLAMTQIEKFRVLAESVEFDDAENYETKLNIVKNQYFKESVAAATDEEVVDSLNEQEEQSLVEEVQAPKTEVSAYFDAISRTIKK